MLQITNKKSGHTEQVSREVFDAWPEGMKKRFTTEKVKVSKKKTATPEPQEVKPEADDAATGEGNQ